MILLNIDLDDEDLVETVYYLQAFKPPFLYILELDALLSKSLKTLKFF